MVTHETPGDTFWDKIKAGANQAAQNNGITLKYSNDPDPGKQATLIQNAVDSKVDGIATTLATPDALAGAVKSADDAGIPVVAFNSGIDQYKQVGREDVLRLRREPRRSRRPASGSPPRVARRCSASSRPPARSRSRPAAPASRRASRPPRTSRSTAPTTRRSSRPCRPSWPRTSTIDWIVTLGAPHRPRRHQGRWTRPAARRKLATFDLNVDAAQAIKDGKIQFSVDQQPYVQGYLAVQSLYLNKKNGNDIGGGLAVLTGPSFVDTTNIAAILPFAKKNTR